MSRTTDKEDAMHHRHHLTLGLVGLMLLGGVSQSWGGPPNNDVSDANGNTAGGTNALLNNIGGYDNTAFGDGALWLGDNGLYNTAVGFGVFMNNTGNYNTAIGAQ